jgi:Exopolysaccharide biosynthesis protein YbjH
MKIGLIVIILVQLIEAKLFCQSLNSLSGDYNIPTAMTVGDGNLIVGSFFLDKRYVADLGIKNNSIAYFATLGFLPFMEISARFTKQMAPMDALGDRMISVKFQIMKNVDYQPAVAVGVHDFLKTGTVETNRFNALYIVGTEGLRMHSIIEDAELSAGFGVGWLKAQQHQYVGLFGGIRAGLTDYFDLMSEYDGKSWNGAVRLKLLSRIYLLAGLMNFNYFCGGASFSYSI